MPFPGCLSALASLIRQIAIFALRIRSHYLFRFRHYSVRSSDETLLYDGPCGRKGGHAEAGPELAGALRQNVSPRRRDVTGITEDMMQPMHRP